VTFGTADRQVPRLPGGHPGQRTRRLAVSVLGARHDGMNLDVLQAQYGEDDVKCAHKQDYTIHQIVVIAGVAAGLCSMASRRPSWKNEASRMLGTRATNGRGERSPSHFKKRSPSAARLK
jgi:hypothetical protein